MPVTIRAAGIRVTDRAIQIDLDGERHWLPKSQIESLNGTLNTLINCKVSLTTVFTNS